MGIPDSSIRCQITICKPTPSRQSHPQPLSCRAPYSLIPFGNNHGLECLWLFAARGTGTSGKPGENPVPGVRWGGFEGRSGARFPGVRAFLPWFPPVPLPGVREAIPGEADRGQSGPVGEMSQVSEDGPGFVGPEALQGGLVGGPAVLVRREPVALRGMPAEFRQLAAEEGEVRGARGGGERWGQKENGSK
jgi:hypothetical protein